MNKYVGACFYTEDIENKEDALKKKADFVLAGCGINI